jgi:hypothetical protein
LLEAVFFTARVCADPNPSDNLYGFFSACRRVRIYTAAGANLPAFVGVHGAWMLDASPPAALTRGR